MNLHGIAGPIVAAVNPMIQGTLLSSTGYSTSADGTQVPSYAAPITGPMQVQALTYKDLQQIDGLNIQGEARAIYLYGDWNGVVRPDMKGGDLISIASDASVPAPLRGTNWLVKQSLENWPDWSKVVAVRQL